MSNKAMTHVWENSQQKGNALLVLLAIADMANDDLVCYPGKAHLSRKCRIGLRALKVILGNLEKADEIQIYHRRAGQKNATNVYRILMGNRRALGNPDSPPWGIGIPYPGESGFPTPGESGFPTLGNQDSPKPSVNPKKESIEKQKSRTPFDLLIEKDEEL